ncbi:MAG TPA: TonB family protein [Gemmatimonadaceae bacterium]|nr:TonB family protein [Gemmatimonadaceae bacterium]
MQTRTGHLTRQVLLIMAGGYTAAAGQAITGRAVLEDPRLPLKRAVVELVEDGASTRADSTSTDSSGVFYLSAAKPGSFYLRIGVPGFGNVSITTPVFSLATDQEIQREFVIPQSAIVHYAFQTQQPVRQKGLVLPKFPQSLRATFTEGYVRAQWVVDTTGKAEHDSFRILRSRHPDFDKAVQEAVFRMRFEPARLAGRPVRQLVEQEFNFRIDFAGEATTRGTRR